MLTDPGGQHLRASQALVCSEQPAHLSGHRARSRRLVLQHVPVELGRPAHRLAGVVDDEVQARPARAQVRAEGLDARCVAQIEAEDLEPGDPELEVGLLRIPGRGVTRKSRRHDQLRAGTEELDSGLIADLHPPARQQRHTSPQICRLRPLAIVEVAARRTQLVVERMHLEVVLLADVAVLRCDQLSLLGVVADGFLLEAGRREHVGRREHRLLAQHPDAGPGEHGLVPLELGRLLLAPHRLPPPPPLHEIGVVDVPGSRKQPGSLLHRQRAQQAAVADDRLEQLGRLLKARGDAVQALRDRGRLLVRARRHRAEGTWQAAGQTSLCHLAQA